LGTGTVYICLKGQRTVPSDFAHLSMFFSWDGIPINRNPDDMHILHSHPMITFGG